MSGKRKAASKPAPEERPTYEDLQRSIAELSAALIESRKGVEQFKRAMVQQRTRADEAEAQLRIERANRTTPQVGTDEGRRNRPNRSNRANRPRGV